MIWTLFAILASLAGSSVSLPVEYFPPDPLGVDYSDYFGPFCADFYRRGPSLDIAAAWRAPASSRFGPLLPEDNLDLLNPPVLGADWLNRYPYYYYPGHSKSIDVAKENFVRGDIYGTTEVGTRDEVSVRNNGYLRPPYYRYPLGSSLSNFYRRLARPAAVPRFATTTDALYLKR